MFCSRCGARLETVHVEVGETGGLDAGAPADDKELPPNIMICPVCGRRNFKVDTYCFHCDALLHQPPTKAADGR